MYTLEYRLGIYHLHYRPLQIYTGNFCYNPKAELQSNDVYMYNTPDHRHPFIVQLESCTRLLYSIFTIYSNSAMCPSATNSTQVLLPRTKSVFFQRFNGTGKSGKKKLESHHSSVVVGELEVGKSPVSDLGGDRLREMEKIHSMEEEEVGRECASVGSRVYSSHIFYFVNEISRE